MRKLTATLALLGLLCGFAVTAQASPESDLKAWRSYYSKQFPTVALDEYANGVYAIDPAAREQWESMEEFPPYEIDLAQGKELFNKPFKNGKTYASCFENGGVGIAHQYPYFDTGRKEVVTLELAINECREKNGEEALPYGKGKIASLLAYMTFSSRGKRLDIKIPNDAALAAYEEGKRFFYTRRGQLNMACAHCHIDNAGKRIRSEILSPALGHATHFPVYRSTWQELGTLHRRFQGCNEQVRAKAFKAQSKEYRNLEYFLTYMSNGLPSNGPGMRK